jgi:6-pyruvoyltetrahydropterin/6-carboxytetrahydropterin synthase
MLVSREFSFDSAHFLPDYHGKCEQLHGHTYKLQVTLEGEVQKNGMVVDFVKLKEVVSDEILSQLDHKLLNDIIKNPSAENTVIWIWERLSKLKWGGNVKLYEIKLWETPTTFITYRG